MFRNGTDACTSTSKHGNCVGYAVPVVSALLTAIFTAAAAIALTYFCLARRTSSQNQEPEKREEGNRAGTGTHVDTSQSSNRVYLTPIQQPPQHLEDRKPAESQLYPEVEPYEYVQPCNPTSNQETDSVDGYVPMMPSPRLQAPSDGSTDPRQLTVQYQSLTGRYATLPYDRPVPL
jgi:hypothetical protein